MKKVKYLILGAGPAGLTFANVLKQNGIQDFLVIEKEEEAGGLCRSKMVDGSALDIGGGHFLDVRRPEVVDFLFNFMPKDEWNEYVRDSQIYVHGTHIGHPFEANIWQLDEELQQMYLESIKKAGCNNGKDKPEKFTDWIYWKLGDAVADNYMLPYNRKVYGEMLDDLGTYWLEKLPNVSYEETLLSCKEHKAFGTQPGHARFYYPKKAGFGEVFLRMADNIKENIVYNEAIKSLNVEDRTVNNKYQGEVIINTIPLTSIDEIKGVDDDFNNRVNLLKSTGVYTEYIPEKLDTTAQWIYYPDEDIEYHRILVRHNFLQDSNGYWTETTSERYMKFSHSNPDTFYNEYAYPLNTIGKNENMAVLLDVLKSKGIYGLGRWGEWQHYNTDVVIEKALNMAKIVQF